jgi:hypothetical protein
MMHIRIYGIAACGVLKRLPPTQTTAIPDFQGKTPVAQMHFALELPRSKGNHSISGQRMNLEKNRETPLPINVDRLFDSVVS